MSTSTSNRLSRRTFLKLGGATAALAYLRSSLGAPRRRAFKPSAAQAQAAGQAVWKAAYCSGCHQPTCSLQVKKIDGVIVEVMGDPEGPTNHGALCPRGLSLAMHQYNPYRAKAPLRRTNPKRSLDEDPGWVEISWEEALSTVAAKLTEIHDFNPKSLMWIKGFGREEEDVGLGSVLKAQSLPKNGTFCPEHFAALHLTGTDLDRLDLERCNYVVFVGGTRGGGFVISDSSHHFNDAVARGMRVVNVDPHSNNAARVGEWAPIRPGTEVAFGLGLLNTIIHEIREYDRWWLRVRSNAPYLLPIEETYLKGTRVFTADYIRDPETNKPLVWDSAKGAAVPFDDSKGETYALLGRFQVNGQEVQTVFQALSDYVEPYTADWASGVTTLAASQIRSIAADLVKEARIGATIEIDGFTFPYSPATIDIRRAAAGHRLGTEAYKALQMVNILLGNSDVPGGIGGMYDSIEPDGYTPYLKPDEDGLNVPTGGKANQVMGQEFKWPADYGVKVYYPHNQGTGQYSWKAICDPATYHVDFPAKGLVLHGSNPFQNGCDPKYVQQGFEKLEFITSIAYHFDAASQLADIILPEDSILEATMLYRMCRNEKESIDSTRGLYMTSVKHQVVDRLYNTRSSNNILLDLAQRMGVLADLNADISKKIMGGDRPGLKGDYKLAEDQAYTWEEIVERKLKSDYGPNTSFADFEAHAFRPEWLPNVAQTYNYYSAPENATRLPLYLNRLATNWKNLVRDLAGVGITTIPNQDMDDVGRHYSAFPIWYEPPNFGAVEGFPLYAIQWKDHFTNQNTVDRVGNAWIHDVINQWAPDSKSIVVPAHLAEQLGLHNGDEIVVESVHGGKTQGKTHISNLIHPECIGIGGNYGRIGLQLNPQALEGPHFNVLMSPDEPNCDPVECSLELAPRVKIYQA